MLKFMDALVATAPIRIELAADPAVVLNAEVVEAYLRGQHALSR